MGDDSGAPRRAAPCAGCRPFCVACGGCLATLLTRGSDPPSGASTRYEKTATVYLAGLNIAGIFLGCVMSADADRYTHVRRCRQHHRHRRHLHHSAAAGRRDRALPSTDPAGAYGDPAAPAPRVPDRAGQLCRRPAAPARRRAVGVLRRAARQARGASGPLTGRRPARPPRPRRIGRAAVPRLRGTRVDPRGTGDLGARRSRSLSCRSPPRRCPGPGARRNRVRLGGRGPRRPRGPPSSWRSRRRCRTSRCRRHRRRRSRCPPRASP